jgi:hypothetical protein
MKAHEFADKDEILDEWSDTSAGIKKELVAKGYTYLGKGVDQTAYFEPSTGLVLKIFGTSPSTTGKPATFSKDQKMFFDFASFCMKHSDIIFLPKFFGYESFVFKNQTYLQIRQERLFEGFDKTRTALYYLLHEIQLDEIHRDLPLSQRKGAATLIKAYGKEQVKKGISAFMELRKIGVSKQYTWDIHIGNILAREDGTPVLVDPWVVH